MSAILLAALLLGGSPVQPTNNVQTERPFSTGSRVAGPVIPFEGIQRSGWGWKSAAASHGSVIAADYLLTRRCLAAGTCVEANPRGQTDSARLKLAVASFAAFMACDYAAHRFIHRRGPLVLRIGLLGHRAWAHADVGFQW